jgi:hypothetical protein
MRHENFEAVRCGEYAAIIKKQEESGEFLDVFPRLVNALLEIAEMENLPDDVRQACFGGQATLKYLDEQYRLYRTKYDDMQLQKNKLEELIEGHYEICPLTLNME